MTITKSNGSKKKEQKDASKSQVIDEVEAGSKYGIRSYLNQFYELASPTDDSDPWSTNGTTRRAVYFWRALLIVGICALVVGAVGIIVAYLWPHHQTTYKIEDTLLDGRYLVVDRFEDPDHQWLRILKIVALTLFGTGGMAIAIALLVPTFCFIWCERPAGRDRTPKRTTEAPKSASVKGPQLSPTQKAIPIPIMEAVQPSTTSPDKQGRTISESDLLLEDDK